MIQDIAPHIYHNEYTPHAPNPSDQILYYEKDTVLIRETDGEIAFPTFQEVQEIFPAVVQHYTYLFSIDEISYYLVPELPTKALSFYEFKSTDLFRTTRPRHLSFAGITGYQLFRWYQEHQFCGACGCRTKQDQKERMLYCPHCKKTEYPKLCPAVIVAIRNKNKLLLSKYAGRKITHYALIAGFAEIGEPIEDTVRREVMEEVGLKVKNLHFYKSQPWSFTDTLLFGFFCDLDGDDAISLDEEELSMAVWMDRDQIPDDEYGISLTREMMTVFKNGQDKFYE